MDLLCKIFNFILNIFTSIVTVIAKAVTILGDATVDVLTDLTTKVGNSLADILFSSPLGLVALGLGAWFLVSTISSKKKTDTITVSPVQPLAVQDLSSTGSGGYNG